MNPRTRSPVGPGSIDKVRMSAWGSPLSAATRAVKRSPRAVLYSRTYLACSVWSVVVFNRAWSLFHSACSRSASARLSFSNSDSTLRSPLASSHHPSSAFGGVGVVVTVVVGVGGVGTLGVRGVLGGGVVVTVPVVVAWGALGTVPVVTVIGGTPGVAGVVVLVTVVGFMTGARSIPGAAVAPGRRIVPG